MGLFFKFVELLICMSFQWFFMVLNSKINVLTPETAPFVLFQLGITTLEAFLGLMQGGGGMLDLYFSKKNLSKIFPPKFSFIRC